MTPPADACTDMVASGNDAMDDEVLPDETIADRVLAGELGLFELLMRRYNRRLFRVARSVLRDGAEAEDVVQDAWVRAYANLAGFEGRSRLATWVTRICVHEALARARRAGRV